MSPRRWLVVAALALALPGCASDPAALRFEAERASWHLDRLERRLGARALASPSVRADLRARHLELARRFGPERPVPAGARLGPDEELRYAIAGASALDAAELAARDGTDDALRRELADVATRYAFDPDVAVRARVREGLAWEAVGEAGTALASYRAALEAPDPEAGASPEWERLRSDLELHVVLRAGERGSPAAEAEAVQAARARLARRAAAQDGPLGRWIRRRLAEVCAVGGDGEEAARLLAELIEGHDATDERAELRVRLGEVHERLRDAPADAEALYRTAGTQAAGRPAGTDGRLHLGDLLRRTDRPREAVDAYALVIAAAVVEDDPARAEALWGRGLAFDALNRWEDAIPAFARGADEPGPFGLGCAARLSHRYRLIGHPEAEGAAHTFVTRCADAARAEPPPPELRDWAWRVRRSREAAAWDAIAEELDAIARDRAGTGLADSARAARAALAARVR